MTNENTKTKTAREILAEQDAELEAERLATADAEAEAAAEIELANREAFKAAKLKYGKDKLGKDRVRRLNTSAGMVIIRKLKRREFSSAMEIIQVDGQRENGEEKMASLARVYPDEETYEKMLDSASGLNKVITAAVVAMSGFGTGKE